MFSAAEKDALRRRLRAHLDAGVTQKSVATAIGYDPSSVSRFLSRERESDALCTAIKNYLDRLAAPVVPDVAPSINALIMQLLLQQRLPLQEAVPAARALPRVGVEVGSAGRSFEQRLARVGREDGDALLFNIAAINADMTNRHRSINNLSKLSQFLTQLTERYDAGLFTLSEIGKQTPGLVKALKRNFNQVSFSPNYDSLAFFYRETEWEIGGAVTESAYGKFLAVPLQPVGTRLSLLYVSAHMPYRQGKQLAWSILTNFIEEEEGKYDGVLLAGDFNQSPTFVMEQLPGLRCAVPDGHPTTARGLNTFDNVFFSDAMSLVRYGVHSDVEELSHHPVDARLRMER